MITRALATAGAMCASLCCHAVDLLLPPHDQQRLRSIGDFHMLGASTPLPREVLNFCADSNGLIAAPGARWNATDVRFVDMPTRRLVWTSRSDRLFVVHYEQGGFVHSYHVAVARAKSNDEGFELVWRADGPKLTDHAAFVRALDTGAFRAEPPALR